MGGEDRERIAIGAGSLGDCVFFVQRVPFSPRIIVAEMGAGNMGQWANSFCGISAILDSGFLVFAVRFFGCCAFCCGFIKVLVARGVVFFRPSIFLSFIPGFSCLPFFLGSTRQWTCTALYWGLFEKLTLRAVGPFAVGGSCARPAARHCFNFSVCTFSALFSLSFFCPANLRRMSI